MGRLPGVCLILLCGIGGCLAAEFIKVKHVLAFYHTDYGNPETSGALRGWGQVDKRMKRAGNAARFPALGAYDSLDPKIIAKHCTWAAQAGITGLVVHWSGPGDSSDRALPVVLETADQVNLRVTVAYGPAHALTAERAIEDLDYLRTRYARHPIWLTAGGKTPIFFISGPALKKLDLRDWAGVVTGLEKKCACRAVYLADGDPGPTSLVFDGIYGGDTASAVAGKSPEEARQWARTEYAALVRAAGRRLACVTVSPGAETPAGGDRGQAARERTYAALWEEAIAANPSCILVDSWNDWRAGSEIEPSEEAGLRGLQTTARMVRRLGRIR